MSSATIGFSHGAEGWIEFGPVDARQRVAFHDYAALYAVPGLYERVFDWVRSRVKVLLSPSGR